MLILDLLEDKKSIADGDAFGGIAVALGVIPEVPLPARE